jgi:predicted MFS family arabinose efflux permease
MALFLSLVLGGIIAMRRLRRRLPPAWADGGPEERFLYLATIYLPVSLVGFAVSGFFVSFAYLDPIYYLAAMMVGVYVSVEAKLHGGVPVATRAAPSRSRRTAAMPRRAAARSLGPVPASYPPFDAESR